MNAKDNSRASFDRQAATYDIDRNGFPPPPCGHRCAAT